MDIMTMVQMQIVYNVIINVKHVQDLPIIVWYVMMKIEV
jgi:hypothetical protein